MPIQSIYYPLGDNRFRSYSRQNWIANKTAYTFKNQACYISRIILLWVFSLPALAAIQFVEVTRNAGMTHEGKTYGASWGDFNGDGWPDLWVGNHGEPRSLYLNQRNGKFIEIAKSVLSANPKADKHGAAWADFDNDGDQDLIELVGASRGKGSGENLLFVNDDGILRNEAAPLGVDYPLGRGRTPLWFEADNDGLLDLLLMNAPRKDGQGSSAIFRQSTDSFVEFNQQFQLRLTDRSRLEKRLDRIVESINNLTGLSLKPGSINAAYRFAFAQLADISGDGHVDLIIHTHPMRIYSIKDTPFEDITKKISFPNIDKVQDVAIEDFNNDSQLDLFMVRSRRHLPNVILTDSFEVKAFIKPSRDEHNTAGISFQTEGEVDFVIHPPYQNPSNPTNPPAVFVGSSPRPPGKLLFTLSPKDPTVADSSPVEVEKGTEHVIIRFQRDSNVWTINCSLELNLIIRSTQPIDQVQAIGFEPSKGENTDHLLVRQGNAFRNKPLSSEAKAALTACHSVAAGDYDNDMDMDLYLVCAGPVENLPNRLYENDGRGNFHLVPDAGGATGSTHGRGNVVVTADYDRDGFLDLFVTNGTGRRPFSEGPHQLFRNRANQNHWLEIDLEGVASNRDGIGAMVELETGGSVQIRSQGGGMHRFAQNHTRLHFGLGSNQKIERLTVRWPSGIVQHLHDIDADQILRVKEAPEPTS